MDTTKIDDLIDWYCEHIKTMTDEKEIRKGILAVQTLMAQTARMKLIGTAKDNRSLS